MKTLVDIFSWPRKDAHDFFSQYSNPYMGMITSLNVTNLVKFCHLNNYSFYGVLSYLTIKTLLNIDAFKYGYDDKKNICYFDNFISSNTILDKNNNVDFTNYILYSDDLLTFLKKFSDSKKKDDLRKEKIDTSNFAKVYISCVPWVNFTSLIEPHDSNNIDSVPRVCFGKYYHEDGNIFLNYSIKVNHAFQDGYHIGLFFKQLQDNIDSIYIDNDFIINRLFIDFDGVILDTPNYIEQIKRQYPNIEDQRFYATLDWTYLLEKAKPINDSLNVLKELARIYKGLYILTKVNSIREQIEKIKYIREKSIDVPIITVPPTIKKSQLVMPNNTDLLVDDNVYNVEDWINNGGISYLFSPNQDNESGLMTIDTLKKLIKK